VPDDNRARLLDAIERDLADVELALARLDAGTYDTCEVCTGPLADGLLVVAPVARRCPACQ
jgi:DnaK suppressor protein